MGIDAFDDTARWFGGKGRSVVSVEDAGAAAGLRLRDVRYADGVAERYLDVPSGFVWADLLSALRAGPISGADGSLELRRGPALDALAIDAGSQRVPATDQSNTLVVIDERLLVKAYRRLEPGPNAEVEVLAALAGHEAPVPPFAGSIHWVAGDGTDTAIALLQGFVPGTDDGWEGPVERVAAALAEGPPYDMAEWRAAGVVTAELHAALVAAFGLLDQGGAEDLAGWRAEAEAALEVAGRDDAHLGAVAPAVRGRLGALDRLGAPPVTRIHGDLHVAQLLRTDDALLVIDFEGDPIRPLAARRRLSTPLWDVATLLRCLDHLGSAAAQRDAHVEPDAWIEAATAAALDAYCARSPVPVDRELVTLLELAKECMEFVYAVRYLPEWLYAPRAGLRRLLEVM
jgi:maltokinase